MRSKLIQDLLTAGKLSLDGPRRCSTLEEKVVHSVIAEHLKRSGLEATLAVFLPESGYVHTRNCVSFVRSSIPMAAAVYPASPSPVRKS